MSMLYIWHPSLSNDGTTLEVILTRGDSDQIGEGSKRFIVDILSTLGVSSEPQRWSIQSYRCNFYSEYWEEGNWELKWDFIWRVSIHFQESARHTTSPNEYIGIDEIDDYSSLLSDYKRAPFHCLVIAEFSTERMAQSASQKIADTKELCDIRSTIGASAPVIEVLYISAEKFHLRAAIGKGNEAFFNSGYPDKIVSILAESGGVINVNS